MSAIQKNEIINEEKTESNKKQKTKIFLNKSLMQQFYASIALIILFIVFSIISPNFFTVRNIFTVALQTCIIAFMGIGATFVIITGGIDLGIGSVLAFSGVITGLSMVAGIHPVFAITLGLLIGVGCGLFNGFIIAIWKVPPFIATLGMMLIARGITLQITGAAPITGLPKSFEIIGGRLFGFLPIPVVIMIIVAIFFGFILKKSALGMYIYAVGSNEEVTRISGIKINKIKITVYAISGGLSAIAGIVLAARLVTAQPTAGQNYELDAIAASVIGGASLMGGVGTITGTMIGAFIIGILRNGLNMLGVSSFIQMIVIGAIIIIAVYVDQLRNKAK